MAKNLDRHILLISVLKQNSTVVGLIRGQYSDFAIYVAQLVDIYREFAERSFFMNCEGIYSLLYRID